METNSMDEVLEENRRYSEKIKRQNGWFTEDCWKGRMCQGICKRLFEKGVVEPRSKNPYWKWYYCDMCSKYEEVDTLDKKFGGCKDRYLDMLKIIETLVKENNITKDKLWEIIKTNNCYEWGIIYNLFEKDQKKN